MKRKRPPKDKDKLSSEFWRKRWPALAASLLGSVAKEDPAVSKPLRTRDTAKQHLADYRLRVEAALHWLNAWDLPKAVRQMRAHPLRADQSELATYLALARRENLKMALLYLCAMRVAQDQPLSLRELHSLEEAWFADADLAAIGRQKRPARPGEDSGFQELAYCVSLQARGQRPPLYIRVCRRCHRLFAIVLKGRKTGWHCPKCSKFVTSDYEYEKHDLPRGHRS